MKASEKKQLLLTEKISKGLDLVYEKLVAEKRAKNEEIVVMREGKIVSIIP
jgi:hypothetical protein